MTAEPSTSGAFLGVGWAFPVRTEGNRTATSAYEASIRDSVWIVLGTARGERAMRPDFGCGIHDLVFATTGASTRGRIVREVEDALVRWEPRITVTRVEAVPDAAEPSRLLIHVDYRVRSTNSPFNLVYPFYLRESGR